MKRLYKFYPDLYQILVLEREYNLEYFIEEAREKDVQYLKSLRRHIWIFKTITTVRYLFWYWSIVIMIIPAFVIAIAGFTAPVVLLSGTVMVSYPFVFKRMIHRYLDQNLGYKKFQVFLGEYYRELTMIISNHKKSSKCEKQSPNF